MNIEALLRDEALHPLLEFFSKYGSSEQAKETSKKPVQISPSNERNAGQSAPEDDVISKAKAWLAKHTASEVLNLTKWQTHPEKILLLGAYHEANGGTEGWKSSDVEDRYVQAKEGFPKNFPRDIRTAVAQGVVGAVTPRTYRVGRAGWNKIAQAIESLPK